VEDLSIRSSEENSAGGGDNLGRETRYETAGHVWGLVVLLVGPETGGVPGRRSKGVWKEDVSMEGFPHPCVAISHSWSTASFGN